MAKELTLADGRKAVIKDGKGRDLLNAQRKAKSSEEVMWALIAELAEIDGKRMPLEDLLNLELKDCFMLIKELTGEFENLPFPQLNTLSTSLGSPDGDAKKSVK